MPLWRGGPNTRTLPTVLLTPSASTAADMAHLCVPQNQALGVCRGFAPDIQICGTRGRKNLVNATIISNAEEEELSQYQSQHTRLYSYSISHNTPGFTLNYHSISHNTPGFTLNYHSISHNTPGFTVTVSVTTHQALLSQYQSQHTRLYCHSISHNTPVLTFTESITTHQSYS